jgi:hypothetical protein
MFKIENNTRNKLLVVDATINVLLGILLVFYPKNLISFIGIPVVEQPFYASILGAVLFGIGIALLVQIKDSSNGLGLKGAVIINICGGICLAVWLIFGNINVPVKGQIVMWSLVLILVGLSSIEFISQVRKKK